MAQQVVENFNYAVPITPSDTEPLPKKNDRTPDCFWVGGAGTIATVQGDGSVVSFTITASYPFLPFRCERINAAGTAATLIVGLWQL